MIRKAKKEARETEEIVEKNIKNLSVDQYKDGDVINVDRLLVDLDKKIPKTPKK